MTPFSPPQTAPTQPRDVTVPRPTAGNGEILPSAVVRNGRQDAIDAELDQHIADCGRLMLAAYARYKASSDLLDLADADRWSLMQAEAIGARSPEQIARMEADRGLA